MSYDLYESTTETLEIMADSELMAALRDSIRESANGQTVPWEDIKQGNGLGRKLPGGAALNE